MTASYDLGGYKRIYLVHIRKTGGTSLNHIFLNLQTGDSASLYENLARSPDHRIICGDKVYVGWNVRYINAGNYFYAFSHTPLHELDLPEGTFTVTCFRDPVKRVISHYNMLMNFQVNKIDHPCMAIEGKWLGNSFEDFLQRIPEEHLLNQLYMFSARFDASEALARVAGLSHYFFTEDFARGIDELNTKTGLNLKPLHIRKASFSASIPEESIEKLRGMLAREYAFLDRVRNMRKDMQQDGTPDRQLHDCPP
ncbi:MAG: sulfotransferase family 2 domain-containing protein [Nitrosomonadales bacterium]|nr:sulfotransferase family 2 domain-containing protein [Nitrosomonadales bacterium]